MSEPVFKLPMLPQRVPFDPGLVPKRRTAFYIERARALGVDLPLTRAGRIYWQAVPLDVRFWLNVTVGKNGCWDWIGCHNEDGYGTIKSNGRTERAHRIAWLLSGREIPDGFEVLHHCDRPCCVNFDRCLFVDTQLANIEDRHKKGRSRGPKGDANPSRLYPEKVTRGEAHHRAKLTRKTAATIRRIYTRGRGRRGTGQRALAKRYGVTKTAIAMLVRGVTWR